MAQLVRAQVSYFRMTTIVGNPEVVSSILTPSNLDILLQLFCDSRRLTCALTRFMYKLVGIQKDHIDALFRLCSAARVSWVSWRSTGIGPGLTSAAVMLGHQSDTG